LMNWLVGFFEEARVLFLPVSERKQAVNNENGDYVRVLFISQKSVKKKCSLGINIAPHFAYKWN
jgi:hypothetical protein